MVLFCLYAILIGSWYCIIIISNLIIGTVSSKRILGCSGDCSSAIEQRERVCSSNSDCLLRLFYPCYNESACANRCTGNCTGTWIQTGMGSCSVYCDGGTRTVQYTCRDQSKQKYNLFSIKVSLF